MVDKFVNYGLKKTNSILKRNNNNNVGLGDRKSKICTNQL